ncbi:unnamed protein product, partial [Iphiclides podalirius]
MPVEATQSGSALRIVGSWAIVSKTRGSKWMRPAVYKHWGERTGCDQYRVGSAAAGPRRLPDAHLPRETRPLLEHGVAERERRRMQWRRAYYADVLNGRLPTAVCALP